MTPSHSQGFDSWESYFYPPPHQYTLRNKLGERSPEALRSAEYLLTARRQRELESGAVQIPRSFDGAHLRAIHRHLFTDVYEWAGQYRTVDMSKGLRPTPFAGARDGGIDSYLADVHRLVEGTPWHRLDRDQFAERAAATFAHLNQAHPFREGNGRSSKVFMAHVAERSNFTLDFSRVSPEVWNQASMLSGPDLGQHAPHPDSLVPVFRAIAQDRAGGPIAVPSGTPPRSVVRASYPQAAPNPRTPVGYGTPARRAAPNGRDGSSYER